MNRKEEEFMDALLKRDSIKTGEFFAEDTLARIRADTSVCDKADSFADSLLSRMENFDLSEFSDTVIVKTKQIGRSTAERIIGWGGGFAVAACAAISFMVPANTSVSKIAAYEPSDYFMEIASISIEISDISNLVAQEEMRDFLRF